MVFISLSCGSAQDISDMASDDMQKVMDESALDPTDDIQSVEAINRNSSGAEYVNADGAADICSRSSDYGGTVSTGNMIFESKDCTDYHGSDNILKASPKEDPEITIDDIAGNVGDTVDVNVTIAGGDAQGYIFFDGELYIVKDGQTTIAVNIETAGMQAIFIYYTGDEKYNNKTAPKAFNAGKAASSIVIDGDEEITTVDSAVVTVTVDPMDATGGVSFSVDGYDYGEPVEVVDGVASTEIYSLSVGNHTITAKYNGDTNHNSSEVATMQITVSLAPVSMDIEVYDAFYGESAYVIVSGLDEDATGNVSVTIGDYIFTAPVEVGYSSVEITGLAAGEYEFNVSYSGDDKYEAASDTGAIEIYPERDWVWIDSVDDVVYNESVEVNYTVGYITQMEFVVLDSDDLKVDADIDNSTAGKLIISGLNAGSYTIRISNAGDENHSSDWDTEGFNIYKADYTIEIEATGDMLVDSEINVTFNVPEDIDGILTVTDDGYEVVGFDIKDGNVSIPGYYAAGPHTVIVSLTDDTNYENTFAALTFNIDKVDPEISISDIEARVGEIVEAEVSIAGGDANGFILYEDIYYPVSKGQTTIPVFVRAAGENTVALIYVGDDKYLDAEASASFNAEKGLPEIEILGDKEITVLEKNDIIVFVYAEGATGSVTVTLDDEYFGNYTLEGYFVLLQIPELTLGNHTIAAKYDGDDNYEESEVAVMEVAVSLAPVSMLIEVEDAVYGEPAYVFVYDLPDNATGSVTVTIGNKTFTEEVENGSATIEINDLAAGEYEFNLTYSGDDIYETAFDNAAVEIIPDSAWFYIYPVDDAIYNESVEVTFTAEYANEIAYMLFDAEGLEVDADIDNSTAGKLIISGLKVGEYNIAISCQGDGNHTSSYDYVSFNVLKADTTIEVEVTGDLVYNGEVNITFNVPEDIDGILTLTVDGYEVTGYAVKDGKVNIPGYYATGSHMVIVSLTKDSNYNNEFSAAAFEIDKVSPEIIISDIAATVGDTVDVNVTITGEDAEGFVYCDDKLYLVQDGKAVIPLDIKTAGIQTIIVYYLGDDNYYSSFAVKAFNARKAASAIEIAGDKEITTVGEAKIVAFVDPENVTGTVSFTVDGTEYGEAVEIADGIAVTVISGLTAGNHTIAAKYNGDTNYNASQIAEMDIIVDRAPVFMEIEVVDADYGCDGEVIVTGLPDDATGTVSVTVGNKIFTGKVENASATVLISDLAANEYEFNVTYSGDDKYYSASDNGTIDIYADDGWVWIDPVDDVVYNESVEVTYTIEHPTEVEYILLDADGLKVDADIDNSTAGKLIISGLNAGAYTIRISNAGDENYSSDSDSDRFKVLKADYTIEIETVGEMGAGLEVNITFKVPEKLDGVLCVTVDGEELVGYTIENGNVTIPGYYAAGPHTVIVNLTNDTNYNDAIAFELFDIAKLVPVVGADDLAFVVGNDGILKITGPANGNLVVSVYYVDFALEIDDNGNASLDVSALDEGTYTVDITYLEDDNYCKAIFYDAATITVNPKDVVIIKVDDVLIDVGDTAVIKAGLPYGTAGENVTIAVSGKGSKVAIIDANGTAVAEFSDLDAGEYEIIVTYDGDDAWYGASANATLTVSKVYPDTSINVTDAVAENNVTVTVTLPDDATGMVFFYLNDKNYFDQVHDGVATLTLSDLAIGNYTIYTTYGGDEKYYNSIEIADFKVIANDTYEIKAESGSIQVGDEAQVTVMLPEDAEGSVFITVDNATYFASVANGYAAASIPDLAAGTYTAQVVYTGDEKYAPSNTTAGITVDKVSDVPIDAEAEAVGLGENATIDVTLPEDAKGTVTVKIEGKSYTSDVENGTASITVSGLTVGNHTAQVSYSGDDKYESANTTVTLEITDLFKVLAPDVVKYYHGSERFRVYVLMNGEGVADKAVNITVNGVTYERTTDANGTASIALNLESGTYDITTKVDDVEINSTATIKATVEGSDITKIYRNATQYYATFYDTEGNPLAAGTEVKFNINGVMYNRKTYENGTAKLNINLGPETYILTAINPVTGEMQSNTVTVLPNIVENHDLTKYYKNASQYVIKVLDGQGRPASDVEVTFNINGVYYTRTSNTTGHAKMNINLIPGTYTITAMYDGFTTSNTVTVLPVLEADDLSMKYKDGSQFKAKLLDGQGKAFAGQKITFNIRGILYDRTTDDEGIARLNINLMPGNYIITSIYSENAAKISNKITVLD